MKKQNNSSKKALIAGIGAVTIAAGAIGAYLYGTKDGAKKRKQAKSWMLKAKAEVLEELEALKDSVSEDTYNSIVHSVLSKYKDLSHVDLSDFTDLAQELRAHWDDMKADFGGHHPKKKSSRRKAK